MKPGRCPYGLAKQADSFAPVIVTFNEIWVEIIVRSGSKCGSHCCYYLWNAYVRQELLHAVNDHTMGSLRKQTVSHSSGDQSPVPSPQPPLGPRLPPPTALAETLTLACGFCLQRVLSFVPRWGERNTRACLWGVSVKGGP